jgi:hypothetical protein
MLSSPLHGPRGNAQIIRLATGATTVYSGHLLVVDVKILNPISAEIRRLILL